MFRSALLTLGCTLGLSTALAQTPASDAPQWVHYGNTFTVTSAPIAAKDFLSDPSAHTGKTVLVEGRIADVCQKMGCWLVLAEGDKSIRVLTKAHKFTVATDSAGETCRIEGVVNAKDIDPKEVAHFESESANKDAIPEHSVTTGKTFELIATGVEILRPEGK
jgi:hypothetical protein